MLVDLPFIWFEEDCPFYTALYDYFAAAGYKINKKIHSSDEGSILDFLKSEIGPALIRVDQANALKNEMNLVIWEQDRIHIPLSLAWLEERSDETPIKEYIHSVKQIWQAHQS